jgi:hypothetical protein
MSTKEEARKLRADQRERLLLAGLCTRCKGNRTEHPGHTGDRCAACANKARDADVERMRKKRGTTTAPTIAPGKRGPRENVMSLLSRSDVHAPDKYKPFMPGQRKASWPDTLAAPNPPARYGSLTLEDIRIAASTLPLKPPGK